MAALSLVLLFAAGVLPGGRMVVTALAGVVSAVIVVKNGVPAAVLSWIAVSILAILLLPNKGCALLYSVFFAPYAILKNYIERIGVLWIEWGLKLAFCLTVSVGLYFLSTDVLCLFPSIMVQHAALFFAVVAVAFIVYDIAFSKLISELLRRMTKL